MTIMQASVMRAVHDLILDERPVPQPGLWPRAIELATSGRVALDPLVTARYPLSDVAHALTTGTSDPSTVKVVVTPTS